LTGRLLPEALARISALERQFEEMKSNLLGESESLRATTAPRQSEEDNKTA
jgi:hypothetical protein